MTAPKPKTKPCRPCADLLRELRERADRGDWIAAERLGRIERREVRRVR